ncbi:MAG: GNAT family N-acetyltransferase [Rubellimicrobium sp.]|nr:GNAT family N-acetyltransferase [Rubellimicrobium sp.]
MERLRGFPVPDWRAPPAPGPAVIEGRLVRLERLDPGRHGDALWDAWQGHDWLWDYMGYGPFADRAAHLAHLRAMAGGDDPMFYAICPRGDGRALGVASWLRIAPGAGSIEVGHICLSPALQRRPEATEAMALMMAWAFDAGYRRYEWKCDALNLPSRRAAERFGFSYEGVFRQAMVVKGRNRDTAWFAVIDSEWPALRAAFDRWLDPANFDAGGRQRTALSTLTHPLLVTRDPVTARIGRAGGGPEHPPS